MKQHNLFNQLTFLKFQKQKFIEYQNNFDASKDKSENTEKQLCN